MKLVDSMRHVLICPDSASRWPQGFAAGSRIPGAGGGPRHHRCAVGEVGAARDREPGGERVALAAAGLQEFQPQRRLGHRGLELRASHPGTEEDVSQSMMPVALRISQHLMRNCAHEIRSCKIQLSAGPFCGLR